MVSNPSKVLKPVGTAPVNFSVPRPAPAWTRPTIPQRYLAARLTKALPPPSVIGVRRVPQTVAEEVERQHGHDHRRDRQHQPRVERDDADVLRLVQQHAPARDRRAQAETEKREG